jgi:ribonuclease III
MNRRAAAVAELEARIGYAFTDRALLERALTHASAAQGRRGLEDNERLEFLGDRVLGMVIAEALCRHDSAADEGDLSKRLHTLVDKTTCAAVARAIGLDEAVRLPGGEPQARQNDTILADACEALIAALYLELGYENARAVVLRLWAEALARPIDTASANPKSELQEWAASLKRALPRYRVLSRQGADHAPTFTVEVQVDGFEPATALGKSRQEAEKSAAQALLQRERPQ